MTMPGSQQICDGMGAKGICSDVGECIFIYGEVFGGELFSFYDDTENSIINIFIA